VRIYTEKMGKGFWDRRDQIADRRKNRRDQIADRRITAHHVFSWAGFVFSLACSSRRVTHSKVEASCRAKQRRLRPLFIQHGACHFKGAQRLRNLVMGSRGDRRDQIADRRSKKEIADVRSENKRSSRNFMGSFYSITCLHR